MKMRITLLLSLLILSAMLYAQSSVPPMPSMIHVDGGSFMMGNNAGIADEKPLHNVTLTSYFIGKYEVTFSEFSTFIKATGYKTDAEQPDTIRLKHGLPPRGIKNGCWNTYSNGKPVLPNDSMVPVGNISWHDAAEYCKWLSKTTGKKFHLPSEAEWEFAARGGMKSKNYTYSGGNNIDEVAWYLGNSERRSHTIGKKMANELDIYDMTGNMREWCSDWYSDTYYKTSAADNPAGPERGSKRVIRGGSWGNKEVRLHVSYRNNEFPYNSSIEFGFRVAMVDENAVSKPAPIPATNLLEGLDTKGFIDVYGINFDIGKYKVKVESYLIIDQIASYLKDHAQLKVVIEGHTDNTGSDALNMTLSDKRAAAIKAEIVKCGIDPGRMETKGYGATKPIADNKTAEGRTQNRRVTIKKQ